MKRPLVWIGTLVTAVITAVAVTLAGSYTTGKFSHASSPKPPSGPPVRILTEAAFADAGMDGGTYFFARPLILNRAQLNTISRFEDTDRIGGPSRYSAWMQAHGGVAADDLIIRLVAAGNRRHLVRILNIDPVGTCTKPLSGTIMNSPSAGDDPTDYIAFNLYGR